VSDSNSDLIKMKPEEYFSKARELANKDKWEFDNHGATDAVKHQYSKKLIHESLTKGIMVYGKVLYKDSPEKLKKYKNNHYCLHSTSGFFKTHILIEFYITNQRLVVHHCSPCGGDETEFYKNNRLKDSSFKNERTFFAIILLPTKKPFYSLPQGRV